MPETENHAEAAPPAPEVATPAAPEPFLVKLVKDAETIRVHPACVAAHLAIGWRHAD